MSSSYACVRAPLVPLAQRSSDFGLSTTSSHVRACFRYKSGLIESSFDNRDKNEEPIPNVNPSAKLYPTKAYTFGVSRGDAVKVHVGEVYHAAQSGKAGPGPG